MKYDVNMYENIHKKTYEIDPMHLLQNGALDWKAVKKIAKMYYSLQYSEIKSEIIKIVMENIEYALQFDTILSKKQQVKFEFWCRGFTETEIANMLNVTQQHIHKEIKAICKQVLKQVIKELQLK